jgi:hypothetical protein
MRKGLRQAKKEKNYEKALQFSNALASEGKAYGMTGSAEDTSSLAQGRVNARDALSNQMRGQLPAMAGQTREGNIAAAKAAGTFDATRQKYNQANSGKKVMDEAGNIMDAPATPASTPSSTPTSNAPSAQDLTRERFGGGGTTPSAMDITRERFGGGSGATPSAQDITKERFGDSPTTSPGTQAPLPALPGGASTDQPVADGSLPKLPAEVQARLDRESKQAPITGDASTRIAAAQALIKDTPNQMAAASIAARPKSELLGMKSGTPNGPTLSTSAPKMLAAETNTDTSKQTVGDVMMNNLRQRPGFDAEAEAAKRPSSAAAQKAVMVAARAKGGPVKAGKPYLVGEEGPEIVVPDEDGEVLPNEKLRKKSRKELQKMLSKR